jgi:hypothetical protein
MALSYSLSLLVVSLFASGISTVDGFAPNLGPIVSVNSHGAVSRMTAATKSAVTVVVMHGSSNKREEDPSEVEYVFISMEEAEEALRKERARFDKEKAEMRYLLEVQRNQLEELAGRREHRNRVVSRKQTKPITGGLMQPDPVFGSVNGSTTTKSVSVASAASSSSGTTLSNSAPHDQAMKWADTEGGYQQQDQYQEQLRHIEHKLRHVLNENTRLMQRLQDQHKTFQMEKNDFKERIMEERERLQHLREELHMERAYFETSRKLLENLLETEKKKVMALKAELFERDMMGRQFAYGAGPTIHEEYVYQTRHTNNNGRRAGRGLEMNMNDIRTPLYP